MRFTLSKTGFGDRKLGIRGWGVSQRLRRFRIFRYRFDLFVFIDGLLDNSLRCNQLESSPPELALQEKMS